MPDVKETEEFKSCVRKEAQKTILRHVAMCVQVAIILGTVVAVVFEILIRVIPATDIRPDVILQFPIMHTVSHVFLVIGTGYIVYIYMKEIFDEAIRICYNRYNMDEIKRMREETK